MARLQDFSTVTPAGGNNLLIVQSQGQGLATINTVGQKIANDTTMSGLNTTSKKLVGAINEVNNKSNSSNITSQVTWNEDYSNARVTAKDGFVHITYQGESTTHSASTVLAVLPQNYRPLSTIFIPFVKNAVAYGNVFIYTNGNVTINQISSTTATGRIYFSTSFPIS